MKWEIVDFYAKIMCHNMCQQVYFILKKNNVMHLNSYMTINCRAYYPSSKSSADKLAIMFQ